MSIFDRIVRRLFVPLLREIVLGELVQRLDVLTEKVEKLSTELDDIKGFLARQEDIACAMIEQAGFVEEDPCEDVDPFAVPDKKDVN